MAWAGPGVETFSLSLSPLTRRGELGTVKDRKSKMQGTAEITAEYLGTWKRGRELARPERLFKAPSTKNPHAAICSPTASLGGDRQPSLHGPKRPRSEQLTGLIKKCGR